MRDTVAIFSIPIDNLDMKETTVRAFELIAHPSPDKRPKYIGTVNTSFLMNTHAWGWGGYRHPELLKALREADLVTPDGMPVVWLSHLLGTPLKERVTGADLLFPLLEECARLKKSVFLFGGDRETTERAAQELQKLYPDLEIAGLASPGVVTTGEELVESEKYDREMVREINFSSADILFIALGNPKQEIWFQRIRNQLDIPLSIGVGGTFNFVAKTIKRAPRWMQRIGLEWLYRIIQEPKRLLFRYVYSFFKLMVVSIPLLFYHYLLKILFVRRKRERVSPPCHLHSFFLRNPSQSIGSLTFPDIFDKRVVEDIYTFLEQAATHDVTILDFYHVQFLDPVTIGLLIDTAKNIWKEKKFLYFIRVSPSIRFLLRLHRAWDLFHHISYPNRDVLLDMLKEKNEHTKLIASIDEKENYAYIQIFGQLNAGQNLEELFDQIAGMFAEKNCLIDLSSCNFIDSNGICLLLKVRKKLVEEEGVLVLYGLSPTINQILQVAKVRSLFTIQMDRNRAIQFVDRKTHEKAVSGSS